MNRDLEYHPHSLVNLEKVYKASIKIYDDQFDFDGIEAIGGDDSVWDWQFFMVGYFEEYNDYYKFYQTANKTNNIIKIDSSCREYIRTFTFDLKGEITETFDDINKARSALYVFKPVNPKLIKITKDKDDE